VEAALEAGEDRGVGALPFEDAGVWFVAQIRRRPEARGVTLRAAVDEDLELVTQPPREIAAGVELIDQPSRARRDVLVDVVRRTRR